MVPAEYEGGDGGRGRGIPPRRAPLAVLPQQFNNNFSRAAGPTLAKVANATRPPAADALQLFEARPTNRSLSAGTSKHLDG
jgi:hypothetical protein